MVRDYITYLSADSKGLRGKLTFLRVVYGLSKAVEVCFSIIIKFLAVFGKEVFVCLFNTICRRRMGAGHLKR